MHHPIDTGWNENPLDNERALQPLELNRVSKKRSGIRYSDSFRIP